MRWQRNISPTALAQFPHNDFPARINFELIALHSHSERRRRDIYITDCEAVGQVASLYARDKTRRAAVTQLREHGARWLALFIPPTYLFGE